MMHNLTVGQLYEAKNNIELSDVKVKQGDVCAIAKDYKNNKFIVITVSGQYICDINSILFKLHFKLL